MTKLMSKSMKKILMKTKTKKMLKKLLNLKQEMRLILMMVLHTQANGSLELKLDKERESLLLKTVQFTKAISNKTKKTVRVVVSILMVPFILASLRTVCVMAKALQS